MNSDLNLAEQVALKFHAGQKYGEDEPYWHHLGFVVSIVKQMNPADDRLPVIGWLHDVLEDTECSGELLGLLFDGDIVDAVIAMTKGFYKTSETKDEYLIRCKANPLARQVKMADSFCNLQRSMQRVDLKRVQKYGSNLAFLAAV